MTEWRWVTFPDYWHISSQVGGTGNSNEEYAGRRKVYRMRKT
jgi:hypothetical protein